MRRILMATVVAGSLIASFQALAEAGPQEGQVFGSILGGYYEGPSDLDADDVSAGYGGAIGFAPTERWSVEAMFLNFDPDVDVGAITGDGDMDYWSINFLRKIGGTPEDWQPYLVVGGGRAEYDYGGLRDDDDDQVFTAGVGVFANLTRRLQLRADVRGAYHNQADDLTPMATAGLTLLLGGSYAPPPPADSDGDGVSDPSDACPGTPAGTPVDSRGCERDEDGDGVVDGDDACPGTAAGVSVDSRGCAMDSDGDGVPDDRDQCPDTPAGTRVDERGCEQELAEPVSFDLTVQFALDSAEITGVAFQEVLGLLRFLREYPSTTAVIEGHTDSQGDTAYNQKLSEERAQAVVEVLTNSGIERERLTARGFGESRPIADNDTADGRAQNRRVSVEVSGTSRGEG